ncbi:MAG: biotin carboxylase N-terminal domain-containing protein [Myxococcales bacterium]|jgi:acetyl/propionyl-CoA carboxylase alpha subunit
MFEKLLIATGGEFALRIARTCERVGVTTIAVHGPRDADAPHVEPCDEAVSLESGGNDDPYADSAAIIAAARASGAQAVHPGDGPLAHEASFAKEVASAGLTFIGPGPDVLERLQGRQASREIARQAGVRALPSAIVTTSDVAALRELADEVGYPLRVEAATPSEPTGGGAGPIADDEDELEGAVHAALTRLEGNGITLMLEHHLDSPRRLEVELLADAEGECVALGERECSVLRPGSVLLAESPAPALEALYHGELKRRILWDSAIRTAKEGGYVNAATAVFLMDAGGNFFFDRMVPHLQLQHVAIEQCTGLDLVELQLRIAASEPLPSEARNVSPAGHAIEARLVAEDPKRDFESSPGTIEALRWPTVAPGALRVETAATPGASISADRPLVASMTTYAPTRHQALLTLDRVLAETVVAPCRTNLSLLREILADEAFRAGQYDIGLVARLRNA